MNRRVPGFRLAATIVVVAWAAARVNESMTETAASVPQETAAITVRTADEPILVAGRMDGPEEYQFHSIEGAVRTSDGGIIVGVGGSFLVALPSVAKILPTRSGGVWVERYRRPGEAQREWFFVDDGGRWSKTLYLTAARHIVDAGTDWVLVHTADSLGVQRLAVYELVEVSESGRLAPRAAPVRETWEPSRSVALAGAHK